MKITVKLEGSKAQIRIEDPPMVIGTPKTIDNVCKAEELIVTKKKPQIGLVQGRYFFLESPGILEDDSPLVQLMNSMLVGLPSRYWPQEYAEINMRRYYIKLSNEDKIEVL